MASIDIFTAKMRQEFVRSMQVVGEPGEYKRFTLTVPSTARVENYPWMTPSPGIQRYLGKRRFGQVDSIKYSLENVEYDGAVHVPLRDFEDDQVGGYPLRMNELVVKAGEPFRSRLVMQAIANGSSTKHFDGTNFFATTHTLGTANAAPAGFTGGGNSLAFSAAASDGGTFKFCILMHNGYNLVKPLLYQDRKQPRFMTDAGTPQAFLAKRMKYWIDLEAVCGYGYWWDAVLMTITNLPTLTELFTCVDACRVAIRGFQLPTSLKNDPVEYAHAFTSWKKENCTIVCGTGLEQLFTHLLGEERIGVSVAGSTAGITNNIYYGKSELLHNPYM